MNDETKICRKCGKQMKINQFYKNRAGELNDLCKKCLTMHIDNFNPETYVWILKDMNFPYIPSEWNVIRDKAFAKNPNLNGTSVFGKYMSKMWIKQHKDETWEDSEKIQEEQAKREAEMAAQRERYEEELKLQLENGEITESQYKTLVSTETQNQEQLYAIPVSPQSIDNPFENPNAFIDESLLVDVSADLEEEDKIYLAMKWGRLYKPNEWVELEKTYNEMMDSFDIQDADTINTLKIICKTYLKMNQAMDGGDVEGFQKYQKSYNDLRKTAKFTAAQNKENKDEYVDSVGELITMCERDGFIPRYVVDAPQDKIDATLQDMNNYVKKLVTQDLGFGQQIEDAIKKIQIQKEMEESFDQEIQLNDDDFEDYYEEIEKWKQQDEEEYEEFFGDDE